MSKVKNIKVKNSTYKKLLRFASELQLEREKRVTINDAIEELIDYASLAKELLDETEEYKNRR